MCLEEGEGDRGGQEKVEDERINTAGCSEHGRYVQLAYPVAFRAHVFVERRERGCGRRKRLLLERRQRLLVDPVGEAQEDGRFEELNQDHFPERGHDALVTAGARGRARAADAKEAHHEAALRRADRNAAQLPSRRSATETCLEG